MVQNIIFFQMTNWTSTERADLQRLNKVKSFWSFFCSFKVATKSLTVIVINVKKFFFSEKNIN